MKEKDLIELGFIRTDDNDGEEKYHYYTLDIGTDYVPLCLITNASDEAVGDKWSVTIFDYESIIFDNLTDLKVLINVLMKNINEK